jgi:hypothetical protein
MPIVEWNHARVLEELQMTAAQFVDLCILLGCDYCDSIRGALSFFLCVCPVTVPPSRA